MELELISAELFLELGRHTLQAVRVGSDNRGAAFQYCNVGMHHEN